jgi:uncharacterized membrane protein YqjE
VSGSKIDTRSTTARPEDPMTQQTTQPNPDGSADRSLGQLVADAANDLSTLIRGEIELAKLEVKEQVSRAIAGSVMFVVAGVFAFLALIMLLISIAYGLVALGVPRSLAFLIVAVVLVALGALLGWLGYRKVRAISKPERTIDNAQATFQAMKPGP